MSITVTLPDGKALELADGATGADAAAAIGPGLAKAALAVELNPFDGDANSPEAPEAQDLARPLPDGAKIAIVTGKSEQSLGLIRHDAAHVLASAVMELWPDVKISIARQSRTASTTTSSFPTVSPSQRRTSQPSSSGWPST